MYIVYLGGKSYDAFPVVAATEKHSITNTFYPVSFKEGVDIHAVSYAGSPKKRRLYVCRVGDVRGRQ